MEKYKVIKHEYIMYYLDNPKKIVEYYVKEKVFIFFWDFIDLHLDDEVSGKFYSFDKKIDAEKYIKKLEKLN